MLAWEDFELPILRWVFEGSDGTTGELAHDGREPSVVGTDITEAQLEEGLSRLLEFGLIDGARSATNTYTRWRNLRVTADGLRVLGEWPPTEVGAVNLAVARVLRGLVDQAPPEDQTAVRRAAGSISRVAGDVVLDAAKGELRHLGGELST
jgi:hypothetical protein